MTELLVTALLMGFLGAGHCLAMCGGLAAALAYAVPISQGRWRLLLAYNLGRIATYGVLGGLVALLGSLLWQSVPALWPRLLAALLMVAAGLYTGGWWRGLVWLERLGRGLWPRVKPLADRLIPVTQTHQALMLGALWGFLPCGLLYSMLLIAATHAPAEASLYMVAFGAGTLPAVMAGGLLASQVKRLLSAVLWQKALALSCILWGLWTGGAALYHGVGHRHHHTHSDHSDHSGHSGHEASGVPNLPQGSEHHPASHHSTSEN